MPDSTTPTDAGRLAERREFVRHGVLRANRFIAAILAVVVLMGVVLVMLIQRAERSQNRAEAAEAAETERLWRASLAQARAENRSTEMGHQAAALEAVRTAAAIRPSLELRNEAITALGLRDFVLDKRWPSPPGSYGFGCDPDLKYYVMRCDPQVLSLFRIEDNRHVRDFPLPLPLRLRSDVSVVDFAFSGSGKYIFIRYSSGPLTIFETETARLVHMALGDSRAQRWSWPPSTSADDRLLCMNMTGPGGEAVLYDIEKGETRTLPEWPADLTWAGGASQVAVNPAGDRLAWFSDTDIYILDAVTGAVLKTAKAAARVTSLRWDEQGSRLSFHCDNFAVFIWEPDTDRVTQMGGMAIKAWLQRFSQDGRLLLTSGSDGMTRLWDVPAARLICQTDSARGFAFNRRGDRVAWFIPGRSMGTWRITHPENTRYFQGTIREINTVWQHDITDDAALAVWTPSRWSSRQGFDLVDLRSGELFHHPSPAKRTMGFLPGQARRLWLTDAGRLRLADLPADGLPRNADWLQQTRELALPAGFSANGASWSADGSRVAVSGADAGLAVLDAAGKEPPVLLERGYNSHDSIQGPGSLTGSGAMSISPDARWVAAGRYTTGGNTLVWDARTGRIVQRLPDLYQSHVVFSPDGRWLFIAGTNGAALWSTGTWERRWVQFRSPVLDTQSCACFSRDSSLIAWSRSATRVDFMTLDGSPVAELDFAELGYVAGLRFGADGDRLFVTGMEGRMLTVDVPALRRQLAEMNIDWNLQSPGTAAAAARTVASRSGEWSAALLALLPVILAAVLGVLVLRRQGRLTEEFVEATRIASQRERELAAEKEVSELKSRFVTTVSHEFRTPLGVTMSAVELLRHYEDRLPQAERKQLFDDIHTATRNMAELMEQVLVLGRVDAGKLPYKPAPLDLDGLARRLADESLSATNRRCTIEWNAENDLSGAHADEALLRHILTNLLSNGVKYSPAGATVQFSARREGPMAVFTVADKGIGIPEEDLPHLFQAFHRAGNVGDIPGTGLGLVISSRCASLHGGSIRVKSAPGEGTAFTVRIPAWT